MVTAARLLDIGSGPIGDFHDDAILPELPEASSVFLSCLNFAIPMSFRLTIFPLNCKRKQQSGVFW